MTVWQVLIAVSSSDLILNLQPTDRRLRSARPACVLVR
jgi:hypothetical protein